MITLTKEWLLKTIAELEEERDATPSAVNEEAANALAAMKLALEMLSAEPVYQCEFCHQDSNGELQWHWEDVNKDFYDQYDSERRGKRRILYTALPVVLSETAEVAQAALNYIDCIPADIAASLPAMPGFDRDWAENVLAEAVPKGVRKCI